MTLSTVPTGISLTNQLGPPLALAVLPDAMSSLTSKLNMSLPEGSRSGSPATAYIRLADQFDNAVTDLSVADLVMNGTVTGMRIVPAANFTAAAPGNWSYTTTLDAIQKIAFYLRISGAAVGTVFQPPTAAAVAERSVDFAGSVRAAALQADGSPPSAPRPLLSAASPIAANAWHVVHVPPLRLPASLGPFVADPGLTATIKIQALNATTGAPDPNRAPLLFTGHWSWTNGTYVVPLKLAADAANANTTFAATVSLVHPSGVSVSGGKGDRDAHWQRGAC